MALFYAFMTLAQSFLILSSVVFVLFNEYNNCDSVELQRLGLKEEKKSLRASFSTIFKKKTTIKGPDNQKNTSFVAFFTLQKQRLWSKLFLFIRKQ